VYYQSLKPVMSHYDIIHPLLESLS